ncbi:hypothetical protein H072_8807 [Dactylellina haptotyla CBS 200.50]|uniref:Nephrocystin 3-like N-terminal domain-containing protein n=1 Tax=Dactylellina haptotyla (strain CBS 200.50) TaxID=1284197 RepID=S8A8S6_DACHA|nr:hypothetical protein H072_8807 [Dactylellina haptotyla CBS 200.50]
MSSSTAQGGVGMVGAGGARSRVHSDYTIGWVCALPNELTAAIAMLDERHSDLSKPPTDHNTYTLGSIHNHNIVIACLPRGKTDSNSAASVAVRMIGTFPSIKFGLMVGIGGGVPPRVRLGDVVISTPDGEYSDVIQWGLAEATEKGRFKRLGALNSPPIPLLTALTKMTSEHELTGSKIPDYLELKVKYPKLASKYSRSKTMEDVLFRSNYRHVSDPPKIIKADRGGDIVNESGEEEEEDEEFEEDDPADSKVCPYCDRTKVRTRSPRDMRIHHSLILSGNQVVKDPAIRDALNISIARGKALCMETEAAGLLDNFPCIIIRGICNYNDSHEYKCWEEHAAAIVAASAKELLLYIQSSDVEGERPAHEILENISTIVTKTDAKVENIRSQVTRMGKEIDIRVLDWLAKDYYSPQQNDYIRLRQPGTGQWLFDSPDFQSWINSSESQILFCPGIPGVGKTIITSSVIHHLSSSHVTQSDQNIGLAYIYFNYKRQIGQNIEDLLSSLLRQLISGNGELPEVVKVWYREHWQRGTRPLLPEICDALVSIIGSFSKVFIVADALDECTETQNCRARFLSEFLSLKSKCNATVNLFATSRFIPDVVEQFRNERQLEIRAPDEDIRKYLRHMLLYMPGPIRQRCQPKNEG